MDLDVLDAIRDRVREHRARPGRLRRVLDQLVVNLVPLSGAPIGAPLAR